MICIFKTKSFKIIFNIFIISLLFFTSVKIANPQEEPRWWDEQWSYRQEIYIPIDTSNKYAIYQPIDFSIEFTNPCWAINENEFSIRILFQNKDVIIELESQIYDLDFSDESHISSCSIIFLIPKEANGEEKYFVYYDDAEKEKPAYKDHIEIEESYYYYAPIPLVPFESYSYKISQDGFVAYGAALKGQFIGYSTAQQITIFKEGTLDVTGPKDGAAWASFDYFYYYGKESDDFSSTIEKLISKEIFIDGNLMVEFGIISQSSKDDFRTTAIYKCYYSPTSDRRICVHVKHEALKESSVVNSIPQRDSCGNIASLQAMRMRSPSIKDLNFGRMFPFMHVYSEDEMIQEYALDLDPEYPPASINILDSVSDVDLGKRAWASFDDGLSGEAHAIILSSNSIIKSGSNERDGVQIQAFEAASPGILGLETDGSTYYYSRNFYEKGGEYDLLIPEDFIVEYDAEFFTTITNGYIGIDEEAKIFQTLIKSRPSNVKDVEESDVEKGDCSLTTFIHMTSSFPMGSTLAALTGRKFSFISAELYQNNTLISTGFSERVSFDTLPSFSDTKPFEKIKLLIGFLDFKNFTFFKKVRFQNIKPGIYLVKIFKENSLLVKDRKFIGYKIIEVDGNDKVHIFCRPQGSIYSTILDQNGNGVNGATVQLMYDDVIISKSITDNNGTAKLYAPCSLKDNYILKITYKGFILFEESIKQRYIRTIISNSEILDIELYDLKIKFKDTLGFDTPYKINPTLTSNQMYNPLTIFGEDIGDGYYIFKNLYPAEYNLEVKYKEYLIEEIINIPAKDEIEIILPVEYDVKFNIFNTRGNSLYNTEIHLYRNDKRINVDIDKTYSYSLPEGIYHVSIYLEDTLISKRKINVISDGDFDFITIKEPVYPYLFFIASCLILILGIILYLRHKDIDSFLKILAISLVIVSIISPWWVLQGSSTNPIVETNTSIFIIPASIVTSISASNVIAGEIASASSFELVSTVLTLISLMILVGCCFIILNMVFKKYRKYRLSSLFLILAIILITVSLSIFTYGISMLTKLGVGSFFGEGDIDVNIIGEGIRESVFCNWGPNLGFILCLLSIIILITLFIFNIKKGLSKKSNLNKNLLNKENLIKIIKKVMPFIGIFILIYLIIDIGTGEIISTFKQISPIYIIIAAILTLPRIMLRNIQWQYILKKQKIIISYIKSLKIFLIGYFYASVTPGYMGGLIRIPYLKEKTDAPTGKLFINSFVFSAGNAFVLFFMAVIGAFIISKYIPEALPITIIVLTAHVIIYYYFIKKERGDKTFHFLVKFFIPKPLKPTFMKFIDTFYKDFPNISDFIIPFLISIPCWMILYGQIYILGLSFGIKIPYFTFIMLYAIVNIISFIPITSAGLGTREAALIFLFSFYGVDPAISIVISLSGHLLTDVLTGFYGLIIAIVEARDKNQKIDISNIEDTLKNDIEDTKK